MNNDKDDFQGSPAVSPLTRTAAAAGSTTNSNSNPMVNNPMKRASVIERITQKRASMVSSLLSAVTSCCMLLYAVTR